jgi:two-component system chemotaxis sensor kinase CheA
VDSVSGEGTTFRIKIPLTLAIIPALVVRTAGQRFAIPQPSVQELVRLTGSEGSARIERAHEAPVYRLRGELLPLAHLREQLDLPASGSAAGTIVVLQAEGRSVGLVVDAVAGTEDVVVKPLGTQLRDIALYAGAATMGDGGVALILDVAALTKRAGIVASPQSQTGQTGTGQTDAEEPDAVLAAADAAGPADLASNRPGTVRLLLLQLGDGSHAAMPLSAVRRLEKIPRASVDRVGTSHVVNYRAGLLPLVHPGLSSADLERPGADEHDRLTVIVCRIEEITVGLVVTRIVDIVDGEPLTTGLGSPHDSAAPVVVDDHVTSLLDLDDLLLGVDPRLLTLTTTAEALR